MVELRSNTENAVLVHGVYDTTSSPEPEAALKVFSPDCVIHEAESLPWGGYRRGPEGVAELSAQIYGLCELEMSMAVFDAGEYVLVQGPARFTSRQTGRTVETSVVELHRVRDGKITEVDVYYKDTQAVNALFTATAETVQPQPS